MFIKKMITIQKDLKIQNKIEGNMRRTKMNLGIVATGMLVIVSCTKKVDYKYAPVALKEQTVAKSLFDTKAEYLMSTSQQEASRTATDAFPYYTGDNKRVKIEFTKESLRIMETERDLRFASNAENNKLVLEVPISHVQFECAKDTYGNCTNTEEDVGTVAWRDKNTVQIKFEAAKSGQLDLLPIMSSQSFGENCYTEIGSQLVKSNIEKDAINFQVRRTFITKPECTSTESVSQSEQITDATISAIYHYSLVKLDTVISKDYQTISYPVSSTDEQTFGFFSTSRTQLDVDNNQTDQSHIQIMNRWNPNRKEIVYYLSDEFAKPENKMLKDLTYQTVESLNNGLTEAGVKFKINLQEPAGKVPGDIRNSMIVLVEDPIAAGVIGYGPQTEDPVTGEIISARTVMYSGAIKTSIKYTYDDIIREKRKAKLEMSKTQKTAPRIQMSADLMKTFAAKKNTGKTFSLEKLNARVAAAISENKKSDPNKGKSDSTGSAAKSISAISQKKQIEKTLKNYTANRSDEYSGKSLKSQINYLQFAKNCALSANTDAMTGTISKKLSDKFSDDAKDWVDLTDSEKEAAIAIIMPEIWVPTLIHEMGHNLGLRHNFQGSEDKANFYSTEELAAKGIEKSVVSSSVMEYIEDVRALPVLGKYDIAALKFGYLRKVDVESNGVTKTVDVPSTLQNLKTDLKDESLELKNYGFCTDEHVGINAGCKRFDLGTSYTEIVQNVIQSYEDFYGLRNHRAGRANMSLYDDIKYASRIGGIFNDLRLMMEVRERIKYRYNLDDSAKEWDEIDFLKDLKSATLIGGQFLANVLLVPDTTCAVALATKPHEIVAVVNLNDINPEAISCYKSGLPEKYVVVGQAGKSFNSKKDPDSTNSYADQIDVRGIWLDKLMATRTLMKRQTGIFSLDKNTDNYLNVADLRGGILDAVSGLLTDNVVAKVPFKLIDGSVAEFEIAYDLSNTQVIDKSIHPIIANRLGINENSTTQLQQVVTSRLDSEIRDTTGTYSEDNILADAVTVHRLSQISDIQPGVNDNSVMIDNVKYIATKSNSFAFNSMNNLVIASAFEKLTQEQIDAIIAGKSAGKLPDPTTVTPDEKAVWDMSDEVIQAYLNQVIKPSNFYTQLLRVLPGA
jgi:hypothetical protein